MNLPISNQTFKIRSKRPLRWLFSFVWLLLLPFMLFLYLPWWSLLLIWLGSFCLLYFFYLREFERELEYQAKPLPTLDEQAGQWWLLTQDGERRALNLHYLGSAALVWNLKGHWMRQIIIIRPMLSPDDWRQLQVLLRWPAS